MNKENADFRLAQHVANGAAARALSHLSKIGHFTIITSKANEPHARRFSELFEAWIKADEEAEKAFQATKYNSDSTKTKE